MKTGIDKNELLKYLNNRFGLIKMSKMDRLYLSYRQGTARSDTAVHWTLITNFMGYMLNYFYVM